MAYSRACPVVTRKGQSLDCPGKIRPTFRDFVFKPVTPAAVQVSFSHKRTIGVCGNQLVETPVGGQQMIGRLTGSGGIGGEGNQVAGDTGGPEF